MAAGKMAKLISYANGKTSPERRLFGIIREIEVVLLLEQ
jgi:hypothetical protein